MPRNHLQNKDKFSQTFIQNSSWPETRLLPCLTLQCPLYSPPHTNNTLPVVPPKTMCLLRPTYMCMLGLFLLPFMRPYSFSNPSSSISFSVKPYVTYSSSSKSFQWALLTPSFKTIYRTNIVFAGFSARSPTSTNHMVTVILP